MSHGGIHRGNIEEERGYLQGQYRGTKESIHRSNIDKLRGYSQGQYRVVKEVLTRAI